MPKDFSRMQTGFDSPAEAAREIVPGASAISPIPRALYVGVSGHLIVKMKDGQEVRFYNVPVGILPIQAEFVLATSGTSPSESTTALNIVALW